MVRSLSFRLLSTSIAWTSLTRSASRIGTLPVSSGLWSDEVWECAVSPILPSLALSRLGAIRSNSANSVFKQGMSTQLAIEGTSGWRIKIGRAELYCDVHPHALGPNV